MEVLVKEIIKTIKVKKEDATKEIKIYNAIANFLNEKIKNGEAKILTYEREQVIDIDLIVVKRINVLEPEEAFSELAKFIFKLKDIKKKVEELYFFYQEHLNEVVK